MEKLYYKVYQDKESIEDVYYIDTQEGVLATLEEWKSDSAEGELAPVFEPILITRIQRVLVPYNADKSLRGSYPP
jgi:predicted transcriptional regulator